MAETPGTAPMLPLVLVALLAGAALAFGSALFNDGDTGWHLATGRFIIDTHSFPHTDPFSFTFRGQPWTAHEWLADVLMAALFAAGGWAGLTLPFAAAVAGILLLVGRELTRTLPTRYVLLALAGLGVVLAPGMLARPHVLAWFLFAWWLVILLRARERPGRPQLAAAVLMLIWANVHASYLIGLGLVGVFALEALAEDRDPRRSLPGWIIFGLLCLAAAFVTPHGVQGFLYPFQVSGMRILPLIDEWRPPQLPQDMGFALLAAVLLLLAVRHWREIGWVRLLLLAGLLAMSITHSRHQPLFAITGLLAVVPRIGRPRPLPEIGQFAVGVLVAGAVLACLVRLALPLERTDGLTYPRTALAHVPQAFRSAPVLNSYSFGGPLALHGIAPFIDGRSDMYGDDFTILHSRLTDGDMPAFHAELRKWNLRWTILTPDTPLVAKLDRERGWRRLHSDRWAVVHVRTP